MYAKRSTVLLLTFLLASATAGLSQDMFTPLVASPLTPNTTSVAGTDGKQHVVYELVLANTRATPATLTSIEVLSADAQHKVLATYEGKKLLRRLHNLANAPATSPEIEFNGTRLFLIDLAFDAGSQVPPRLMHRFHLMGPDQPGSSQGAPVPLTYTVAPIAVNQDILKIGPPLAGKGWVAVNGCCRPDGVHRGTGLPINGDMHFAQRFAIDWMSLDAEGRMVHGNSADVHSYSDYGANVLAVADGTVVATLDTLDDQVPGTLTDPKTINIENVDGNHIVLDLGHGRYAFYAHLEKKSLLVSKGDHVKRGQVLAKLGNTGNTSAPHLHFHVMDGPSVLGSNGLPYVIDHFELAGEIPQKQFDAAPGIEGKWGQGMFPQPIRHQAELPLDLTIINF